MKYYALLFAIVLLSCKKEDTDVVPMVPPLSLDGLLVDDAAFTGTRDFAVGQFLKITPVSNRRSDVQFSLTLSPGDNEQVETVNPQMKWRPSKPQEYVLGVTLKSSAGEEVSKQYAFKVIPADIRYYLWGTNRSDIEYAESESLSEKGGGFESYDDYIIHRTEEEYARKDAVQPGEHVGYWFDDNDVLVAADVYNVMLNQTDPSVYYKRYEEIKHRLSEYTYLGNEHKWLETSAEAMHLKNIPERWGEAFAKGYVTLCDRFENERTNIKVESYGSDDGNLLIVIRSSRKK